MKLFLLFFILLVSEAYAQQGEKCSRDYAQRAYSRLKQMPIKDKTMHCALSCDLSNKCTSGVSAVLGIAKEVYDVFGQGNAEWADLAADFNGIRLSKYGVARTANQCLISCSALYEPK